MLKEIRLNKISL